MSKLLILYLCFAFILAELNPFVWEEPVRFLLIVLWATTLGCSIVFSLDTYNAPLKTKLFWILI